MNDLLNNIIDYLFVYLKLFFAEYTILLFLVGLAILLLGIFIIAYQLNAFIRGQIVEGTVVGAVKDVKVEMVNGELVRKRLNQGTLFPIFEFRETDGKIRRAKGNTGGSHVYNYKTEQVVSLIVDARNGYQHVSDSRNYSAFILGLVILAIGIWVIYSYTVLHSSFNLSTFIWLSIIASLVAKYKERIQKMIRDYKENKRNKEHIFALKRSFDPDEVRPIEEYLKEREQNRRKFSS